MHTRQFLILLITLSLNTFTATGQNKLELVLQSGHSGNVHSIDFSFDGKYLVSADRNSITLLWELETGRLLKRLNIDGGSDQVEFNSKGKLLVARNLDHKLGVYNIENSVNERLYEGPDKNILQMFQHGTKVYGVTREEIVEWDTVTKTRANIVPGFTAYSISTDGQYEYFANKGIVYKKKFGTETVVKQLSDSAQAIKKIFTGSEDMMMFQTWNSINIYNSKLDVTYKTWLKNCNSDLSENGQRCAVSDFHKVIVLDAPTGKKLFEFALDGIMAVRLSRDGRYAALGTFYGELVLLDATTGKLLKHFAKTVSENISLAYRDSAMHIGYYKNGSREWDITNGRLVKSYNVTDIGKVGYSVDGKSVYTTSPETHLLNKVDRASGAILYSKKFATGILSFSVHPEGKTLFVSCIDGSTRVLNESDGAIIGSTPTSKSRRRGLHAMSTNGHWIVAAYGDSARVYAIPHTKTSKKDKYEPTAYFGSDYSSAPYWISYITALGFSDDGKKVIHGEDNGRVRVRDIDKYFAETHYFKGHEYNSGVWTGVTAIASLGDTILAANEKDFLLRGYSLKKNSQIFDLKLHPAAITAISLMNGKRRFLTASKDGTTKMWQFGDPQPIATFVGIGKEDYLVSTSDNYYLASKGAHRGVAFRIGMQTYAFDQFDLLLNRPDIVLSRIGYAKPELIVAYKNAYLKRLKKMNFTEDMLSLDLDLPEIKILEKNIPVSTTAKQLSFTIEASDKKYKLDRINIYVNDVPVYGTKGLNLRDANTSTYKQPIDLELSQDLNRISVSVLNEKGIESRKQTFEITYTGEPVKPYLYVLAIGVSDYTDDEYDLKYAAKDAKDLCALLQAKATTFGEVKVKLITDAEATRENILGAAQFLDQTKVDDQVIVFVAGHGLLDENLDYYIATTNVNFENPKELGLEYGMLEGLLDGIKARKKLMLLDACHSGEVDKEETKITVLNEQPVLASAGSESFVNTRGFKKREIQKNGLGLQNSFDLMQQLFSDISKGTGTVVISSASGVEFAFESSEWQNGVFTYTVLEALRSGKHYKVSQLKDHVIERVSALTQGKQHPTSRKENLESDFDVW
jgi:WD40 repeat protein